MPAWRMELIGEAPVPPSYADEDDVGVSLGDAGRDGATPTSATSFTEMRASGLAFLRSKMSCARSSIE